MKKIKILGLLMALVGLVMYTGCDEITAGMSECEIQNTGTYIVKNETGMTARIDVDNIEEKIIGNNGQAYYYNVVAGQHRMYIDIGNGWQYLLDNLAQCETRTYRWYISYSKSTNQQLCLDITRDGVTQTYTESDFEYDLERE